MLKSWKLLLLFVLLVGVINVAGCSDDDDDNPLVGTWKMHSESGEVVPSDISIILVLTSEATYTLTITSSEPTVTESGSYSVAGSVLTVDPSDDDPDTMTFAITGNTLTITESEGELLIFYRQ